MACCDGPTPINVTSTSNNADTLSRQELIKFFNDKLYLDPPEALTKVEQLCSGAVYCQLMHRLWPGSLKLMKVKFDAKLETQYTANLVVLQGAFNKLGIDKDIPIPKLIKGRYQDNHEFGTWFYKFYTTNDTLHDDAYDPIGEREKCGVKPKKAAPRTNNAAARNTVAKPKRPPVAAAAVKRSGSNQNAEINEWKAKVEDCHATIAGLERERDFYFQKLRDIEELTQANEETEKTDDLQVFTEKVLEVLYATEDGFGPADEVADEEYLGDDGYEEEQEEY